MDAFTLFLILPLFAAILPFLLWPIELIAPYPFIIEEIAKGFLAYRLKGISKTSSRLLLGVCVGLVFAFSETILYIFNIVAINTLQQFAVRFATTGLLHVTTMLLMTLGTRKSKQFFFVMVLLAMALHFLYNSVVGPK